jgi:hypothetical protein
MTKRTIIVGGGLEEAAKRVAEAWHRAERGETVEPEDNVTFALELREGVEMKEELFADLVESVREGAAILRGERAPSRASEVDSPDGPSDAGEGPPPR